MTEIAGSDGPTVNLSSIACLDESALLSVLTNSGKKESSLTSVLLLLGFKLSAVCALECSVTNCRSFDVSSGASALVFKEEAFAAARTAMKATAKVN